MLTRETFNKESASKIMKIYVPSNKEIVEKDAKDYKEGKINLDNEKIIITKHGMVIKGAWILEMIMFLDEEIEVTVERLGEGERFRTKLANFLNKMK